MNDTLTLYIGEKNISSWSMRALTMLLLKGVPFEERTISLAEDRDRSRRRKVSPTGKVPVLHHGDRVIPDSLAILEYLEETFPPPKYPALWPADPAQRAHARWLAAAMHSGFPKLREHMSFNLCFLPDPGPSHPEALADAMEMMSYWEPALARKTDPGPFLFGGFGGVDAMYAPAIVRLTAFRVPTGDYPLSAKYMPAVLEHPAVRRWLDEGKKLPPRREY
jgi:glutathione S-transferase